MEKMTATTAIDKMARMFLDMDEVERGIFILNILHWGIAALLSHKGDRYTRDMLDFIRRKAAPESLAILNTSENVH